MKIPLQTAIENQCTGPLSPRMIAIVGLLKPGGPVWDLCCDHGYIGLGAWKTKLFTDIHFVDQVPTIIAQLQTRWAATSPRLHFHAQAAQTLDAKQVTGNIVISGVGAKVTCDILRNLECRPDLNVIVSPQKNPQVVRRLLAELGWRLVTDQVVLERGRYRQIIRAGFEGEPIHAFGNQLWTHSHAGLVYHQSLVRYFTAHPDRSHCDLFELAEHPAQEMNLQPFDCQK